MATSATTAAATTSISSALIASSIPDEMETLRLLAAARTAVIRAAIVATHVRSRVLRPSSTSTISGSTSTSTSNSSGIAGNGTASDGNNDNKISKADTSPVTIADFGCQVAVSVTLQSMLGYAPFRSESSLAPPSPAEHMLRMVGEEDAKTLVEAGPAVIENVLQALDQAYPHSSDEDDSISNENVGGSVSSSSSSTLQKKIRKWNQQEVLNALSVGGYEGGGHDPYWILDPIDGTKGYLRGGQYAIGLAYIVQGKPFLSVMACPSLPYPHWPSSSSSSTTVTTTTDLNPDTTTATTATTATTTSHTNKTQDLVNALSGQGEGVNSSLVVGKIQLGCLFVASAGRGATMEPLESVRDNTNVNYGGVTTAAATTVTDDIPTTSAAATKRIHQLQPASESIAHLLDIPSDLVLAESFDAGHSNFSLSSSIAHGLGIRAPPIRIDSMSKYGLLARGDAHVYLRFPPTEGYVEKVWDHAPGALLIQEMGGQVTDAKGDPLDFSIGRTLRKNYGVIASVDKRIHDRVMEHVRKNGGDKRG